MMTRTVPGLLLAAGWLLLLLFGSYLLFWAAIVLIGIIGGREYTRMVLPDSLSGFDYTVMSVIIAVPILTTALAAQPAFLLSPGVFLAFCLMAIYTMYHYRRFENPYVILMKGVLGIFFVGFLGSHLVMIRGLVDGSCWLIILTAITAGSDTGAYWTGRRFGKRKLCPAISPNKTVEGALGGSCRGGHSCTFNVFSSRCFFYRDDHPDARTFPGGSRYGRRPAGVTHQKRHRHKRFRDPAGWPPGESSTV